MNKKKNFPYLILILVLVLLWGFFALLPLAPWGYSRQVSAQEKALRQEFVNTALGWNGSLEGEKNHLKILDIYNSHTPLAQGYTVTPEDNWCAAFVSAVAISCQMTDIIPTECGCQRQIALFRDINAWVEADTYMPLPGDIIYYSSRGDYLAENTGWSDHVGIVVGTWGPFLQVVEGNLSDSVRLHTLCYIDGNIRGYATPAFTEKAAQTS